jgi:hypothetical protein
MAMSWLRRIFQRCQATIRKDSFQAADIACRTRRRLAQRPQGRTVPTIEILEPRDVPSTFTVTNLLDDGSVGSLRWAIGQANSTPGTIIDFNTVTATGPGLQVIKLASALPTITQPVTIDGTSQPGYADTPLIDINANSNPLISDALSLGAGANGSIIEGLKISGFTGTGIQLNGVANSTLQNLDLSDAPGNYNNQTGIQVENGSNNVTITNVNATGTVNGIVVQNSANPNIQNNTLTGTSTGLYLDTVTGLAAGAVSGNTFAGDNTGLKLWNSSGFTVGDNTVVGANIVLTAAGGLNTTGTALYLRNDTNFTIKHIDVSSNASGQSGTGIYADSATNNLTVQNVTATHRGNGIEIIGGGSDLTLTSNTLTNDSTALYVDGLTKNTLAGPVIAAGNLFTNSNTGLQLYNISGESIGTSGTNIVINNATDGLNSTAFTPIHLRNDTNFTISGVDVSWTGSGRANSGTGIFTDGSVNNLTITGVNAANRGDGIQIAGGGSDLTLTNNTLTNDGTALYVNSVSKNLQAAPVIASGNNFTGSDAPLQLFNISGQFIGTSGTGIIINNATDGLKTTAGTSIHLQNDTNFTISGVDVSWTGSGRANSGTGIFVDGAVNNLTITTVNAANRGGGIEITGGGSDLTLTNNTLTNDGTALYFNAVGKNLQAVPVLASGNNFTGSDSPLQLFNMTGQFIGTSGTGIIINNATDGLNGTAGTPILLRNDSNFTISGIDVYWTGSGRAGTGIYADGTNSNLTITNVNAANRGTGLRIGDGGVDATINNNNLTNDGTALFLSGFSVGPRGTTPVVGSGNNFTASDNPLQLLNMSGQFIGTSGTGIIINNGADGLDTAASTSIFLQNDSNFTIGGVDVSWSGTGRAGTGIFENGGYNNLTITSVVAENRNIGVEVDNGTGITIQNSAFSNNNTGVVASNAGDATHVNNNRIVGNTTGLAAQVGGVQVDATNNFWGSATGPGAGGNNGFTGNANATPFLTSLPTSGIPVDYVVTTTSDVVDGDTSSIDALLRNRGPDGVISLREAILAANNTAPGAHTITFGISSGAQTITLGSALPAITGALTIDGTSQPGYAGISLITINDANLGGTALTVSGANDRLKALTFINAPGTAVGLSGASGTILDGLTLSGSGGGTGLSISGSSNVLAENLTVNNRTTGVNIVSSSSNISMVTSLITNNTAAGVQADATSTGVALNQDQFQGNAGGAAVVNIASPAVDARNSYWGSASGPSNLGGTGDGYTGNVTASPFLTAVPQGITASTLTVNTTDDVVDGNTTSIAALIASPGADGKISLREALLALNNTAGGGTINFAIGSGVQTITLTSALPTISQPIVVDGTTQLGYAGAPLITINANGLGGNIFDLTTAAGDTIRALKVMNYTGTGVEVQNATGATLQNLDLSSSASVGISADTGSNNATIQNVTTTGASVGVQVLNSSNPTIQNNILTGTGTGTGLYLDTVTGLIAGAVSGNTFTGDNTGLKLWNSSGVTIGDTSVVGAKIVLTAAAGLNTTGTALYLHNLDNSTINHIDVSSNASGQSGTGINADSSTDNLTIQNVTATHRNSGIQITGGGSNLTLTGNNLANDGTAIYVDGLTGTGPVTASGNTFSNDATAYQLFNMTGESIGTSGTNIVINNATDGLQTATGNVIYLRNLANSTISGLNLTYTGSGRSGIGIYSESTANLLTIQNVTVANRGAGIEVIGGGSDLTVSNNTLTNDGTALFVDGLTKNTLAGPVIAAGNLFTNSDTGLQLFNMTGVTIGTSGTNIIINNATDGLQTVTGNVFYLRNLTNSTISGLNLTYTGSGRSGIGINSDSAANLLTIQNVTVANRSGGIQIIGGGSDLTLTDNTLTNDSTALYVDGLTKSTLAGPVIAAGNLFTNSDTGLQLFNMTGVTIGTSGTNIIINNATDGLQSVTGNVFYLRNLANSTISGLNLTYTGSGRSGIGIYSDSAANQLTVQNVTVANRGAGIDITNGGTDLILTNNTLTNDDTALFLNGLSDGPDPDSAPFSGSGNTFTGSTNALSLSNMNPTSLVIGNSIAAGVNFVIDSTSGLYSVAGTAISLNNVSNVTIDGVDVSYRDLTRSGTGIAANSSDNLTVKNLTATDRQIGLNFQGVSGGSNIATVQNSNFLNNDTGLSLTVNVAGSSVSNSRIEANGNGIAQGGSATLTATNNFWGSAAGPGAGGNNGTTGSNITTSPFLTAIPAALFRNYGTDPPAFGFSTTLVNFAARSVPGGPYFGTTSPTPTADGVPTTAVSTPNLATNGVNIPPLVAGQMAAATVVVSGAPLGAKLDAWIDFKQDGTWTDVGDQIAVSVPVVNGTNSISFSVPAGASLGQNYARFRISSAGGLQPFGEAVDGQVLDLLLPKFADTFFRANAPDLGPNWQIPPLPEKFLFTYRRRLWFGGFQLQSNKAVSLASAVFDAEQVTGFSLQNATLQANVDASNAQDLAVGLMARLQSNGDCYAAILTHANVAEIVLFHAATNTFTVLQSASAGSNVATMAFTINGQNLSLVCGTANISINDSTLALAGGVGIFAWGPNGSIGNFSLSGS